MSEARKLRITIEVHGQRGEYWAETVYAWLLEDVKDILEGEYGVEIEVKFVEDETLGEPVIVCCGYVIREIPSEPGYLIEALKKILDKVMSGASQRPTGDEEA